DALHDVRHHDRERDHAAVGDRDERADRLPPHSRRSLGSIITAGRPSHARGFLSPSRDGWVVRDIEVGFVSFGKPGLRKPGALPSLHVMPINAAYGRLPWEVPALPFGT